MESFALSALAAFAGGALSFLSPCVLPLVPGYLCFAAGLQFNELTDIDTPRAAARRVLPGASAFVGGFSAVFIALSSVVRHNDAVRQHSTPLPQALTPGVQPLIGPITNGASVKGAPVPAVKVDAATPKVQVETKATEAQQYMQVTVAPVPRVKPNEVAQRNALSVEFEAIAIARTVVDVPFGLL